MLLDNTENFYKNKVAELDQTLPPEVTWNKAQGWLQLQSKLPVKRRRPTIWYQVAATIAVLLVSAPFFLHKNVNRATVPQQITKVQQTPKPLFVPARASNIPRANNLKAPRLVAMSEPPKLKKFKKTSTLQKHKLIAVLEEQSIASAPPHPELKATNPVANTVLVEGLATPERAPVKITVVLGGKTSRQLAVYATENAAKSNHKKSNRLKIKLNLPSEVLPGDTALTATTHLLTNRSALSAKIDL